MTDSLSRARVYRFFRYQLLLWTRYLKRDEISRQIAAFDASDSGRVNMFCVGLHFTCSCSLVFCPLVTDVCV